MSYDIWLVMDTGGTEPATVWDEWNFTSNVAPMWRAAGVDLAEHHEKKASDVTPELDAAIQEMEAHPEKYRPMDASNGWGTFDQLLPRLKVLLDAYRTHPHATVRVWR